MCSSDLLCLNVNDASGNNNLIQTNANSVGVVITNTYILKINNPNTTLSIVNPVTSTTQTIINVPTNVISATAQLIILKLL